VILQQTSYHNGLSQTIPHWIGYQNGLSEWVTSIDSLMNRLSKRVISIGSFGMCDPLQTYKLSTYYCIGLEQNFQ
jgi:hypothetical protein